MRSSAEEWVQVFFCFILPERELLIITFEWRCFELRLVEFYSDGLEHNFSSSYMREGLQELGLAVSLNIVNSCVGSNLCIIAFGRRGSDTRFALDEGSLSSSLL